MEKKKIVLETKKEVEETTILTEKNAVVHRKANIHIKDGKFIGCIFSGLSNQYTLGDWKFLIAVGNKIIEITGGYE